jgi:hypothetical protein
VRGHYDSGSFSLLLSPKPVVSDVEPSEIENHLMTLSARASTFGGIVRPICLAV